MNCALLQPSVPSDTLGKKVVEQLRVRALIGKRLGKPRQVGKVRAGAFPTPAALHASNRKQAVGGAGAARADVEQEGPVLLWQPHARLSLKFGKLALGKPVLHDPPVPQCPEHLAAGRPCTRRVDPLTHAHLPLISHAQTARAATDARAAGPTAAVPTGSGMARRPQAPRHNTHIGQLRPSVANQRTQ